MEEKSKEPKTKLKSEVYEWMQSILTALVVCVLVFVFAVRMVNVDGDSMYPTLENGDRVLISNLFYTPQQGDIVVLRKDTFMYEPIVKRVIAVEGQTIEFDFDKGTVTVDGVLLDEPYINEPTYRQITCPTTVTVPEGCVFVMGDNRNASIDSRKSEIGMLDNRLILGKAYCVVYPVSQFRMIGD